MLKLLICLTQGHSNIRSEGIIIEDSSMDKVEMLAEDIEMEDQDISNNDSNQQRVLLGFQKIINEVKEAINGNTMTILETEEVDSEISTDTATRIQIMEVEDSKQEMSEVVDTVMSKIEPDMEVSQSDSLPRIEITEAVEDDVDDDVKKTEPDMEAVSEDELPNESTAKVRFILHLCFTDHIINILSILYNKCTGA